MTQSTLPSQKEFFHGILRYLGSADGPRRRESVHEGVADVLELSAEQRSERLKNLSHLRYRHRSGWSLSTLKAGV